MNGSPLTASRAPAGATRVSIRPHPGWAPWFFVAPFIVVFGTFVAWPLLTSLRLALEHSFGPGRTEFIGLANFRFLWHDPLFWKAVRNTVVFTLGSVFVQLPLSLILALLLNRPNLRGRAIYRLIFFAPSLVGLVFAGLMFSFMFEKRTGLVNRTLHGMFASFDPEFSWLQDHAMAALILAALWLYVGFNMIYFLAALQNVPREQVEAAAIDGASAWQRFRHVVLPEITPVAGFVVLLSIVGSFQLFELPWIMLVSGNAEPDERGLTIVMYLYRTGFMTLDLGYACAIGWVLALVLMAIAIGQRLLVWRSEEER